MSQINKNLILLINPPYTNTEGLKESAGHAMPLNLAYLAAFLRNKINCQIKIIDAEADNLTATDIVNKVAESKPKIVGLTIPTPTFSSVIEITKLIKKELGDEIILVGGGPNPTVLPEETLRDAPFNFLVLGEGEITFYELIKKINLGENDFEKIDGLAFCREGKVIINKKRGLIENLDEIPLPARDLFDLKKYYTAPTKKTSASSFDTPILTSRGCAYNCTFCLSKSMWGQRVRFRSVDNVISEMEQCIDNYKINEFNFFDDTFTIDNKRVEVLCQTIIDKGWKISWNCMGRVNTITDNMVKLMSRAGCKKIAFGLESGNQEVLKLMNKRATLEMAEKAVDIVKNNGLDVLGSFMVGNVGETPETIKQTINFAKKLDLDNATFFIVCPYPGTEIYKIARDKGFISEKNKWEEFAPLTKTKPILIQDNLTAEELIYWQKSAFRKFYLRPRYVIKKIKKLRSWGDLKIIFEGLRIFFRILNKKPSE